MILGKPKKKWRIMMITPDGRDEERIGFLYDLGDEYLFSPKDRSQDVIVYPSADDVKEKIKLNYRYIYGQGCQFTIGNVEHFF